MSRSRTSTATEVVAACLCGLSLGPIVFLSLLRFEMGEGLSRSGAGLTLAVLLAGLSTGVATLGLSRRARLRTPTGVMTVGILTLWAASGTITGGWSLLVAFAGHVLIGRILGAAASDRARCGALLMGAAVGMGACSGGLMGLVGIAPGVCAAAIVAGVASFRVGDAPHDSGAEDASGGGAALLLAVALGAGGAVLLRGYVPAARSLAYAASDLGAAFLLGLGLCRLIIRGRPGPGVLRASTIGAMLTCLVAGFSFFEYPALVISESAVLQTSPYLLTPGCVFPMWVLAFALGVCAGPVGAHGGARAAPLRLIAFAAGAASVGLFGVGYRAPYVLVLALGMAVLLRPTFALPAGVRESNRLRRWIGLVVGGLALAWCILSDPHHGWLALRKAAAYGGAGSASVVVEQLTLTNGGLRACLLTGPVRTLTTDGNLTRMERNGRPLGEAASELAYGLGLAYAGASAHVGVLAGGDAGGPLASTVAAEPVCPWTGASEGQFELIVCDPVSVPSGCLAHAVTREGLAAVRRRLAPGGVFCCWFPAGWVELGVSRRALAGFLGAFQEVHVFVTGRDAFIVGGDDLTLDYAAIDGLFRAGPTSARLAAAGLWDAHDLLVTFAADGADIAALTAGAEAYSYRKPGRPPVLSRDLAYPVRPAGVAALLQSRLQGTRRLTSRLRFTSSVSRALGLRGFDGLYSERTTRVLRELGTAGSAAQQDLVQFLMGPSVRMELFGDVTRPRWAQLAQVMSAFGLHSTAAAVLEQAIAAGKDSAEVRCLLGSVLEASQKPMEALEQYTWALAKQPTSTPVLRKIAGLQIGMGRYEAAAGTLKTLTAQEPASTEAMVMLAGLYMKLGRFGDAAAAAAQALDVDPDSRAAMEMLGLSREAMRKRQDG